jgi:hypothetical protein
VGTVLRTRYLVEQRDSKKDGVFLHFQMFASFYPGFAEEEIKVFYR